MLISRNPTTNEVLAQYEFMSDAELHQSLLHASTAFKDWQALSFEERANYFQRVATLLLQHKETAAVLMAKEMGKPIAQGIAEVEKCAWVCEYFANEAATMLQEHNITTEYRISKVVFQPLGVVFAIMPWNFPFWQVFRCIAPTMMAGNTVVLKHSPEVTGCALIIEELMREAGFPPGAFTLIRATVEQAAEVIASPNVAAVTLTGSTRAGKAVAQIAGAHLKKTVLELGGSDPYIILEDCDVERAAQICVNARIVNSGQSCVAAKRFIVVEAVRERFEEAFVEFLRMKVVGSALDPATHIGPLARLDLRDALQHQMDESIRLGARVLLQGGTTGQGAYFRPAVLSNVEQGMPAYEEELFGPVAAIIGARNEQDAIRIANDSVYGLGAAVFTSDAQRGERVALALDAGCCFVNDFVKSDPRLPFGGVKLSGWGRELSLFGIREFVNAKTLCVA